MNQKMSNKSIIILIVVTVIMLIPLMFYLSAILPSGASSIDDKDVEVISITAEDLINDFYNNEVKADADYIMNWLEVDGEIYDIDGNRKKATLRFRNGEFFDFLSTTCYINEKEDFEKVKELNTGDRVTVTGKLVRRFLGNLELRQCKIKDH